MEILIPHLSAVLISFAIAGLRSLFGVLSNAMSQMQYLEKVSRTCEANYCMILLTYHSIEFCIISATFLLTHTSFDGQAVGVVLGVIAVKLAAETFDIELLTPLQSLVVVGGILGTAIAASLNSPPSDTIAEMK